MKDLLTKDLRRGFVNRNKNCVPTVDLVQIVGKSDQLDLENPSLAEKSVQTALGHKKLQTTKGYSVLDLEVLACTFTATSRNAAVLELVQRMPPRPPQDCNGRARRRTAQRWRAAFPCPALRPKCSPWRALWVPMTSVSTSRNPMTKAAETALAHAEEQIRKLEDECDSSSWHKPQPPANADARTPQTSAKSRPCRKRSRPMHEGAAASRFAGAAASRACLCTGRRVHGPEGPALPATSGTQNPPG